MHGGLPPGSGRGQFPEDPFGDVFLVIDGWFTLRQEYEALEQAIQEIATRGLSYGVHLIVGIGPVVGDPAVAARRPADPASSFASATRWSRRSTSARRETCPESRDGV